MSKREEQAAAMVAHVFQYLTQAAGAAQEAIEELEKIAGVSTSTDKAA